MGITYSTINPTAKEEDFGTTRCDSLSLIKLIN